MPAQEVAFLFDRAVVWEFAGVDRDNEPTVLTPYEIMVRWDGPSRRIVDATGQLVDYDAEVMASENYPLGSIFWLGRFEDLPDPIAGIDLMRSISSDGTYDIRNITASYMYILKRFNRTLPNIVGTS